MLSNLLKTASNPLTKFWGVLFVLAAIGAGIASTKLYINKIQYERERAVTTAKALQKDLSTMVEVNQANADAFNKLAEARDNDYKAIMHLSAQLAYLDEHYKKQGDKIKQLEKSNAEVRAYLNTPVPEPLRRLLDDPGKPAGDTNQGGEDTATRTASSAAESPCTEAHCGHR